MTTIPRVSARAEADQNYKRGERMRTNVAICAVLCCASVSAAERTPGTSNAPNPMTAGARAPGYLSATEMPSSAALVPPPPAPGSAAQARDDEANRQALAMHGSGRWALATQDAVLTFPQVAETFSCAMNASISEARTPKLMSLLRRTLTDAGRSTSEAKKKYQRARPFMVNGKPLCTPQREDALRADGSYPSGHSAIGYAFGLVLSEIAPEHADVLIARGRQFGQSRLVCNVHWASDVAEGQMMGAAVVARLHSKPEFRADVDAARAELAALRAETTAPARDCKLEREALASATNHEGG